MTYFYPIRVENVYEELQTTKPATKIPDRNFKKSGNNQEEMDVLLGVVVSSKESLNKSPKMR
jgi:hypothetical protein